LIQEDDQNGSICASHLEIQKSSSTPSTYLSSTQTKQSTHSQFNHLPTHNHPNPTISLKMSFKATMIATVVAALSFTTAHALPQGGSGGSPPTFDVIARLWGGAGCTGNTTVFAVPGTEGCATLPVSATSAMIVDYEVAGCQGKHKTTLPNHYR
jgi:hypothetical protein